MRWQTGRNSEPYLEREIRKTENMWDQKWQRNRKCLLTLVERVRVDEIKRKLECNAKKNSFEKKIYFQKFSNSFRFAYFWRFLIHCSFFNLQSLSNTFKFRDRFPFKSLSHCSQKNHLSQMTSKERRIYPLSLSFCLFYFYLTHFSWVFLTIFIFLYISVHYNLSVYIIFSPIFSSFKWYFSLSFHEIP